jgi:hypothetical protein
MNSTCTAPNWCAFENIPSGPDAASASACCVFSLSTLEVTSRLDAPGFALTERKRPEVWRWALIDKGGLVLEEGFEPNQNDAKRSAADALNVVTIEVF